MIRLCRWCGALLGAGAVDWCCVPCECAYYLERGASFEAQVIASTNHIAWADVESRRHEAQWWCIDCGSVPVERRGATCDRHGTAASK